jgi:hypothetical protein
MDELLSILEAKFIGHTVLTSVILAIVAPKLMFSKEQKARHIMNRNSIRSIF